MEGEEEEGSDNIGGQSRDVGSLTGWQALANEVIAELGSGPQPASQQAMGSGRSMGDSEENMQVHVALHECMLWFCAVAVKHCSHACVHLNSAPAGLPHHHKWDTYMCVCCGTEHGCCMACC